MNLHPGSKGADVSAASDALMGAPPEFAQTATQCAAAVKHVQYLLSPEYASAEAMPPIPHMRPRAP